MKRCAFRLILVLIVGAIINVAVAWGCAAWGPSRHDSSAVVEAALDDLAFQANVLENRACTKVMAAAKIPETAAYRTGLIGGADKSSDIERLPSWAVAGLRSGLSHERSSDIMDVRAMGWPARSMMLQFSGNMSFNWQLAGGIRLAPESINKGTFTMLRQRALPLIPVWPGFAVNTLLYAAALWLLFAIPLHVRRLVRMKRGRCPECGYELRGSASDVCSECGATVARPQIT